MQLDACDGAGICPPAGAVIDDVTSDEPADSKPDIVLLDATHLTLRAERDGAGDGRVYTIHFSKQGEHGTRLVTVPHDRSAPAIDSGPVYAVTP